MLANKIKLIIALNCFLFIGFYLYSIYHKEDILAQGKTIYLQLAPVDPRSLMQGDYMDLRYAITSNIDYDYRNRLPLRGFAVLKLDSQNVASIVTFNYMTKKSKLEELRMNYFNHNGEINLGVKSYFFQEGKADKYSKAKYGKLKLSSSGESMLVGLCDEKLRDL